MAGVRIDTYALSLQNTVERQVRFNFVIENPTERTLRDQTIWFYAPVKRTATQELLRLEVSLPYELEEDALGNQLVKLHFDAIAPYATKLVTIKAGLLVSAIPRASTLNEPLVYLEGEQFIETDDQQIRQLAMALRKARARDTAAEIYSWVKANLRYAGYVADDLGARYAALNRRGDCTEYAYLATALARANGIPARTLGGYVMVHDGSPKGPEYHNWAEIYVDGAWMLLDAQKENFNANANSYIATRIVSSRVSNSAESAHRFRVRGEVNVRLN